MIVIDNCESSGVIATHAAYHILFKKKKPGKGKNKDPKKKGNQLKLLSEAAY